MSRLKGDCLVILNGQELWVYCANGSHWAQLFWLFAQYNQRYCLLRYSDLYYMNWDWSRDGVLYYNQRASLKDLKTLSKDRGKVLA